MVSEPKSEAEEGHGGAEEGRADGEPVAGGSAPQNLPGERPGPGDPEETTLAQHDGREVVGGRSRWWSSPNKKSIFSDRRLAEGAGSPLDHPANASVRPWRRAFFYVSEVDDDVELSWSPFFVAKILYFQSGHEERRTRPKWLSWIEQFVAEARLWGWKPVFCRGGGRGIVQRWRLSRLEIRGWDRGRLGKRRLDFPSDSRDGFSFGTYKD